MRISTSEAQYRKVAIVSTTASPLDGDEYMLQLCSHLSAAGIEADVFVPAGSHLHPRVLNWEPNVRVISLPAGSASADFFAEEIRSYAQRSRAQYDVQHALDAVAAACCAAIEDITGIPYIMNLHQYHADQLPLIKQAQHIIAPSGAARKMLLNEGIEDEKITLVAIGFDPQLYHPLPTSKAREYLGIDASGGLLLYVPGKNAAKTQMVIDALTVARTRQRGLQLMLLTAEEQKGSLPEGVIAVHINNQYLKKYYYAAADLLVTTECAINGKTNTLYEAMGCGTPVLGIGEGLQHCINNGKTGFVLPVTDADTIAHKMVHVLRDRDLMEEMQLNAVIEAHSMHTWKRAVRLVTGVYRKMEYTARRPALVKEIESKLLTLDLSQGLEERAIA